jgi:hypothetical protein
MIIGIIAANRWLTLKTFYCDRCGSLVFFENVKCVKCGDALGFLPDSGELGTFEPAGNDVWRPLAPRRKEELYRACDNGRQHGVCNWMVAMNDPNSFCLSCRLNQLIPDLSLPGNLDRWHKLEKAKRRLIYTIMRLGLPMNEAPGENRPALRFSFVGDVAGGPVQLTGHLNGLITINIAEADDAERERRRVNLHEAYRTVLGHLRHEIAHYYWDRLIAHGNWLADFCRLFGDETSDYAGALERYYQTGPPPDWQTRYVSAYASAHPLEDWAESWAHYFHILDMVETSASFGMTLQPRHPAAETMTADPRNILDFNIGFDAILKNWFPLTQALNSLNRGMGLPDVYPFVLSTRAIEKLTFIHQVVQTVRAHQSSQ